MIALVAGLHAAQSQRFVPAFTSASAAALAVLAFLQVAPSWQGLAWLAFAVVALHAEFLWPTYGVAGLLGVGAATWGSWMLLAALPGLARGGAALLGTLLLLTAVAHTMRLRTLERRPRCEAAPR
jgi:hypothetical protein